jgi:hypothetical protein
MNSPSIHSWTAYFSASCVGLLRASSSQVPSSSPFLYILYAVACVSCRRCLENIVSNADRRITKTKCVKVYIVWYYNGMWYNLMSSWLTHIRLCSHIVLIIVLSVVSDVGGRGF